MTLISITQSASASQRLPPIPATQASRLNMNLNLNPTSTSTKTSSSSSPSQILSNQTSAPMAAALSLRKQVAGNASNLANEADRFSLNSNLSNGSPSPHSSLASPFSPTSCSSSTGGNLVAGNLMESSFEDSELVDQHQDHHDVNGLKTRPFRSSSSASSTYSRCMSLSPMEEGVVMDMSGGDRSPAGSIVDHPVEELNSTKSAALSSSSSPRNVKSLPQNISNNNNTNSELESQKKQTDRHSLSPTTAGSPGGQQQEQQPVRRLSRIEHRQSLSDLGYGKIESYAKLQRLGKGTYATVYMGRSRLSNDLVALKEILKEHDEGAPCTAIREVSLLRHLRHNNIVTLHDICHTPKKLTLVFEYVGPDLYAYMKENNHLLSIHNVRLLLFQILRGISFCHLRQVLHRDLKPQNLLINSRGELKICDFGLARAKSIPTKSYSNEVVTLWYRPPDVLLGNTDYNDSIDMWGVGCIFFEMSSGRTFFPGSSVRQQLYLIFSCLGAPNKYNWPEILMNHEYQKYNFPSFRPEKLIHRVPRLDMDGMSLLMKFLRYRPSERITAELAKYEPFFSPLPQQIHHLSERESIFDVSGVYMTLNPGQKLHM